MADSSDDNVVNQAIDLFVYAPLGLALEARDLIPKLVDRGRGQVALARLAGRVAAQQTQQRMAQATVADTPSAADVDDDDNDDVDVEQALDDLPIDDYDSLSATQVISLLGDLNPDELTAVNHYEKANRGRVTITNRITKLLQ